MLTSLPGKEESHGMEVGEGCALNWGSEPPSRQGCSGLGCPQKYSVLLKDTRDKMTHLMCFQGTGQLSRTGD